MLGFEIFMTRDLGIAAAMRTTILEAIKTCRAHAVNGIELPYAYFTAGRLSLLLDRSAEALGYYARGVHYCLAATHCFPKDVLAADFDWISRLFILKSLPPAFQWVLDLIELSDSASAPVAKKPPTPLKGMILAGGAKSMDAEELKRIRPLVETALNPFKGTVISGGTTIGVPGCVGDVTAELDARNAKGFALIGYVPHNLPNDAPPDHRCELRECGERGFSPEQIIRSWRDLLAQGILPREVLCLGFGGGPVSSVEYRMALAMGATVAVLPVKENDAADKLVKDPLWAGLPNLFPLPSDPATVRAIVVPPTRAFDEGTLEAMARAFHENYVAESGGRLPDNMKPWTKLGETFKLANHEQARYAIQILEACGFAVREAEDAVIFDPDQFTPEEVERMAEMEHGRWNAERLRDGWRFGTRDDAKKLHNYLVPWSNLPDGDDGIKKYDRQSVRKFPEILAKSKLEVYRT
jgi:hypothetical protein